MLTLFLGLVWTAVLLALVLHGWRRHRRRSDLVARRWRRGLLAVGRASWRSRRARAGATATPADRSPVDAPAADSAPRGDRRAG